MKQQNFPTKQWQAISAYLDGQLSDREKARLEARLETDAALQQMLEELRQTRTVLRHAAKRRAPHNFTLTPAMAAQVKPRRSSPFVVTGMRVASFVSAFLLLITLAGQLLSRVPLGASAPMMAAQEMIVEKAAMPEADLEEPLIITWGTPTPFGYSGVPMGMGGGGESVDVLPPVDGIGGGAPEVGIKGGEPAPGLGTDTRNMLPEATPAPEIVMEAQPTEAAVAAPPEQESFTAEQESGGPILGLQPGAVAFDAQSNVAEKETRQPLPPLAIASIVFGILAVGTGAAAIYLKRRT